MLNINPETVCFLIDRARAFHVKEGSILDEEPGSPSEDWGRQALADQAGDPTVDEFRNTIRDLEPDQQHAVVALMWLGRGDYTANEWEAALEEARGNWTPDTADYLLEHPLLATYLSEGLDQLGYSCDD